MSKSKQDTFYQLISRKDFVDWVQYPDEERDLFWENWLKEHPASRKDFFRAREFVQRLKFQEHHLQKEELDSMLGYIISRDTLTDDRGNNWLSFIYGAAYQWAKVAAILILFLVASLIINGLEGRFGSVGALEESMTWQTVENPRGRKSTITLPDGTLVHLNYESRLSFPERFESGLRQVELEGEAFFEVERDEDRPFKVTTGGLETEVLGTSFNVRSFGHEPSIQVSLVSGKVKVNRPEAGISGVSMQLGPGEELLYEKQGEDMQVRPFDPYSVTAWKEGVILFEDARFEEFADRLEKWYGVDFQVHGNPPQDWKVNGRYDNEKLEDILLGLQFVYDLKFKISGKQVILTFR